jgi:protein-disulfide isomerase
MTNQNKLLLSITVIAIIAIGWYAVRVLPSSFSKSANEPQPNIVRADADDEIRGNRNAAHTIIEFGDLECPTCGALDPQLNDLVKQNSSVRLVWKDCPSSAHPNAEAAAEAAHCAGDQGKYWEYHDLLIQNQDQLGADLYPVLAATLKLDAATFASCLGNGVHAGQVSASTLECANAGVTELPGFFINNKAFSGDDANIIHELTVELSK